MIIGNNTDQMLDNIFWPAVSAAQKFLSSICSVLFTAIALDNFQEDYFMLDMKTFCIKEVSNTNVSEETSINMLLIYSFYSYS